MKKGIALFYWQEIGDCMVETSFSVDTEMEMDRNHEASLLIILQASCIVEETGREYICMWEDSINRRFSISLNLGNKLH